MSKSGRFFQMCASQNVQTLNEMKKRVPTSKTYQWTISKIKAQILLEVNWKEETGLQTLFKQQ